MAVTEFWTEDARVHLPGLSLEGEALRKFVDDFYAGGSRVLFVAFHPQERFVHGDSAYELGQLEETAQFGGRAPEVVHEHYFLRWKREADGAWRLHRFVATPVEVAGDG